METSESRAPKVFISYSHDSREHEDRVLNLAKRLRDDGIDASLDQYEQAPPHGWPLWMAKEIDKADFVLMVCTEIYRKRAECNEEPGKGRGVLWEAKLVYNHLFQENLPRQKYIPILLNDSHLGHIPAPLQSYTFYFVDTDQGYLDLQCHLTGQLPQRPALGEPKPLPAKEPRSYPSSLAAKPAPTPTSLDQRHRQQLIKQIRLDWIDGVLDQSLYKVARIELGLIEHPLNTTIRISERQEPRVVPPGIPICQIFDKQAGALLILGGPGTGKTTLLLELARDLLQRAE